MSKRALVWTAAWTAACLAGGCAPPRATEGVGRPEPAPDAGHPAVIGHLVFPGRTVTVSAGGPRYAIEDERGRVIEEGLTLEGLQARDPEIGRTILEGLAENFSDPSGMEPGPRFLHAGVETFESSAPAR